MPVRPVAVVRARLGGPAARRWRRLLRRHRRADAAVAGFVRTGDHVDILAAPADPASAGRAGVVAADVRVLAVPANPGTTALASDGALLVVATTRQVALNLARAATVDRLSLSL